MNKKLLGHENLHVYQRSLNIYAKLEEQLLAPNLRISAVEHFERASESILENIANANSSWSVDARRNYFGIACGSALECAACLDILGIRGLIDVTLTKTQKKELNQVVKMLYGLMKSKHLQIREDDSVDGLYKGEADNTLFFAHERLTVYSRALDLIRWFHKASSDADFLSRHSKRFDKASTSIVLNIAEGNGRISGQDHLKFIDIAYKSALKSSVILDMAKVRGKGREALFDEGQQIVREVVSMLTGLRGYFEG